jgi:hypothetical protein
MQAVAKSKTEAAKMAIKDVEGKIKAGMTVVKPEDYDRLVNQAMKKWLHSVHQTWRCANRCAVG